MTDTWVQRAACRGMAQDIFFPARGASTNAAKAVCSTCRVAEDCLNYAISAGEMGQFGVWGGTSERQRRPLRAGRRPLRLISA